MSKVKNMRKTVNNLNDVKRKDNFGFNIFFYREAILKFLILYIRNCSMTQNIITSTFK